MYFIDFFKNLFKKSNIGVIIYLIMNVLIIVALFSRGFEETTGIYVGIIAYIVSILLALSPIGEWILRLQTGCKPIKRKEYLNRLMPLFDEVYQKVKAKNNGISDHVKLFMSNDKEPNAFATGRKTICLTKGLLEYSDEEIKAVLAHEFGHIAHKDTDLILIITVGNFIVTFIFVIYRLIIQLIGLLVAIAMDSVAVLITNFFIDVILVFVMWVWTKIGTLLVMHSSRKNEFLADSFAFDLGYGNELASVLDSFDGVKQKGLWANLKSSHPDTDDRVAKLQELGITYTKF